MEPTGCCVGTLGPCEQQSVRVLSLSRDCQADRWTDGSKDHISRVTEIVAAAAAAAVVAAVVSSSSSSSSRCSQQKQQ